MPSTYVFSRPNPDGGRVVRVDGYATRGIGTLGIKQGGPGGPGIHGLPDSARTHGHIPYIIVFRVDRNICYPSGQKGRADISELKGLQRKLFFLFVLVLVFLSLSVRGALECKEGAKQKE
jgi:hypothetical protein